MVSPCSVDQRLGLGWITAGWMALLALVVVIGQAVADDNARGKSGKAKGKGFFLCGQTSRHALRACQDAARSDYYIGQGNCDNLSDIEDRKDCRQDVGEEFREALTLCREQFDARQDACEGLGGGPYDPEIDPANFVSKVDNPYFPLVPGTTFIYDGEEHVEVMVTKNTKEILGITCIEVRDTVTEDDQVIEDTLDWFAQDKDGNVWYMGEISQEFEDGELISLEGSWQAGRDGAKPGIIMKAKPEVGDFYRQEFLLGEAEDLGEVLAVNESVETEFGSFDKCVKTKDFSSLEPDALEHKFYAPGVGFVLEVNVESGDMLELVDIVEP